MTLPTRTPTPIHLSVPILGAVVFLAGVAVFAYIGTFARHWADDYCYSAVALDNGLFGSIWAWYMASGNRFSTIVLVTVSEWFGSRGVTYVPAFTLLVWVAGWWFFLPRLAGALGWAVRQRWWVLLGVVQVFFCVLLAPDRLQSMYWRMGTLHYSFPLGLLLFNLGLIAARWRRGGTTAFALGSGALAFFTAGFSETIAAMQTAALGLILLAGGLALRGQWKRLGGRLGGALAGSLLAMVVMLLSPSNAWRQAEMPPPDSLVDLATYTLRYAVDFTWYSLRGQPVPLVALLMTVGLIFFLLGDGPEPPVPARTALLLAGLSLLAGYVLIAASFAPSAYAGLLYPAGRALMPGRFAFLIGLSGMAAGLGLAARSLFQPGSRRWLLTLAALALLAVCIYPVRAIDPLRAEAAEMREKAQRWDERDAAIRAARDAGESDVVVWEADVVQSLEELNPSFEFWVNRCASAYYRVNSITAER